MCCASIIILLKSSFAFYFHLSLLIYQLFCGFEKGACSKNSHVLYCLIELLFFFNFSCFDLVWKCLQSSLFEIFWCFKINSFVIFRICGINNGEIDWEKAWEMTEMTISIFLTHPSANQQQKSSMAIKRSFMFVNVDAVLVWVHKKTLIVTCL